jgi:hypothetical protein
VKVEHHRIGHLAQRARGKNRFAGGERIVEVGMHEHPAHHVGNQHARAIAGDVEI